MTLQNLSMYNAVVPCYSDEKGERINGDSIKNQERINNILGI